MLYLIASMQGKNHDFIGHFYIRYSINLIEIFFKGLRRPYKFSFTKNTNNQLREEFFFLYSFY